MLPGDTLHAEWVTWLTALATDTRLRAHQRERLTNYVALLGAGITTARYDLDAKRIIEEWVSKVCKNQA